MAGFINAAFSAATEKKNRIHLLRVSERSSITYLYLKDLLRDNLLRRLSKSLKSFRVEGFFWEDDTRFNSISCKVTIVPEIR